MNYITIPRETVQQAYDALELYHHEPEVSEALDALRTALAAPAAQEPYDKTEMNAFVTKLYQEKSTTGQHGFYETLYHVVHKAIERVHGIGTQEQK